MYTKSIKRRLINIVSADNNQEIAGKTKSTHHKLSSWYFIAIYIYYIYFSCNNTEELDKYWRKVEWYLHFCLFSPNRKVLCLLSRKIQPSMHPELSQGHLYPSSRQSPLKNIHAYSLSAWKEWLISCDYFVDRTLVFPSTLSFMSLWFIKPQIRMCTL